jgi:hypothetical protein
MSPLVRTILRTFLLVAIVCYAQETNFATKVGADTTHVENASDALGTPDGKLALVNEIRGRELFFRIAGLMIPRQSGASWGRCAGGGLPPWDSRDP